ncbi:MAG: hypothetical protein FJZ58_00825 [Chlamydiae bacterium]|nr:hypothetical protein [Chlamydiota bacterium]
MERLSQFFIGRVSPTSIASADTRSRSSSTAGDLYQMHVADTRSPLRQVWDMFARGTATLQGHIISGNIREAKVAAQELQKTLSLAQKEAHSSTVQKAQNYVRSILQGLQNNDIDTVVKQYTMFLQITANIPSDALHTLKKRDHCFTEYDGKNSISRRAYPTSKASSYKCRHSLNLQ